MSTPSKRLSYDAIIGLKVVKLALQTLNMIAAGHYCVNMKQVWK